MRLKLALTILLLVTCFESFGQVNYQVRDSVQDCVNVRTESNSSSAIVGCLSANTHVTVIGSVPFWREITFSGKSGLDSKEVYRSHRTANCTSS